MYRLLKVSLASVFIATPSCYARPNELQESSIPADGVDPTGVRDSTQALSEAMQKSPSIKLSCGTYRLNLRVANTKNVSFEGSGSCTILKPQNPKLPVISIELTNFSEFKNFSMIGDSAGGASGIVVKSSGNTTFSNIMSTGFGFAGLHCIGGVGSSGIKVIDSYLLENANAGILYENCQDFFIRENNIGKNSKFGILIRESSAGQVISNYVWENGVGISAYNIFYDWFSKNRITQSKMEGFKCDNCGYLNVSDNQSYQNSVSEKGIFDDWMFEYTRNMIFSNNILYDWTATPHSRYGVSIDKRSSKVVLSNNIFENQHKAPLFVEQGAVKVTVKDNQ